MTKPLRFGSAVSARRARYDDRRLRRAATAAAQRFHRAARRTATSASRLARWRRSTPTIMPTADRFRRAGGRQDARRRRLPRPARQCLFRRRPLRFGRSRLQRLAVASTPNQPQVVLKLALVEIAQGKNAEALSVCSTAAPRRARSRPTTAWRSRLPVSRTKPFDVLETAARAQGADSRVRQNLALAYALSGDWTNARTIAAQDVPADQLDARIQQWMQLAKPATAVRPGRGADRRHAGGRRSGPAGPPRAEQGRHALAAGRAGRRQLRSRSAVQVAAGRAAAAAASIAAAGAASRRVALAAARRSSGARRRRSIAARRRSAPEAPAAFAAMAVQRSPPARQAARPRRAAAPASAPPRIARTGNATPVVQLGAYQLAAARRRGLEPAAARRIRRCAPTRRSAPASTAPKGTFYRLSVKGFANQREALLAARRCQAPAAAASSARRGRRAGPDRLALSATADQQFEAGHAHGHAHFDLKRDQRPLGIVGDRAVDLDAAVHRAGMHDDRVRRGACASRSAVRP